MQMFGRKQESVDKVDTVLEIMEETPTRYYWIAALVTMSLSAMLYMAQKRTLAIFVGQWTPTLILLSLFYRLLKPSQEHPEQGMKRARAKASKLTMS